jgi:hypothetical protein
MVERYQISRSWDLNNCGGPSKSQWSSMKLTCTISRRARVGKNECLEHAPEARLKMSTIGSTSHRGSILTTCRECVGIYHTLPTLLCRKQAWRVLKTIMQSKVEQ